jgi:DNA mismatch endonuclease (patch repair protein)
MRRIRSANNASTDLLFVSLLKKYHIVGWRRNQKLPGKPDFAFRKQRVVVFVDGCFWHGCPKCYRRPSSNRAYWDAKVQRNRLRDRRVTRLLRNQGWRVVRVWECDLKKPARTLARIRRALNTSETAPTL